MPLFDRDGVLSLYRRNLDLAKAKLSDLEVFCGHAPNFGGLSGWVFEQTVNTVFRRSLFPKAFILT